MNVNDYISFDFETTGLDPLFHEICQIGAKAYRARTLEPYPVNAGGEFKSMMKPMHFDRIHEKAMQANSIKIEDLYDAPDPQLVWNQFVQWVNRFNPKKTPKFAPIPVGKNIRHFDMVLAREACRLYCPKKDKTLLFNEKYLLDLDEEMFKWFESSPIPERYDMDTLREFFGLPPEGAHDALVDAQQVGMLIMKFTKLTRRLKSLTNKQGESVIKFEGCCAK